MNDPNKQVLSALDSIDFSQFAVGDSSTIDDIWTPWTDHSSLNFTQGLSLGEADIEHFPELAHETEDYL